MNTGVDLTVPDAAAQESRLDAKNCGLVDFKLDRTPVDVMLVLDVSGSMEEAAAGGTKWANVSAAMRQVIQATQKDLNWGLKTFPNTTTHCMVSPGVDVPVAASNYAAIDRVITANTPPRGSGTPTADAIAEAAKFLQGIKSNKPKYILLATDGEPTCPYRGAPTLESRAGAYQAVREAAAAGVSTFVVGVATDERSGGVLNQLAAAGGRPKPVDPLFEDVYYLANDQKQLLAVMSSIAGQIASCVFALTKPPPSPDDVAVDLLKDADPSYRQRAPRDGAHADGWDYTGPDKMAIALFGSWCDKVQALDGTRVKFTFGCPGEIIP